MGKIRNLCMTQLVRMKKNKKSLICIPGYFLLWTTVIIIIIPGICLSM